MKTIWKYELDLDVMCQRVRFRKDAEILSVQNQNGTICLWALVESEAEEEYRLIANFGTGHRIPDNFKMKFIDTVQQDSGQYIWHFFEVLDSAIHDTSHEAEAKQ